MTVHRTMVSVAFAAALFFATTATAAAQAGTYTLVQINGQDLPVQSDFEDDCHDEIHAATLSIQEGSQWVLEYREVEVCPDETDEDVEQVSGGYVVNDETIVFSENDESDDKEYEIDVDELGTGTVTSDGIEVTLQDRRTVLTFRRR